MAKSRTSVLWMLSLCLVACAFLCHIPSMLAVILRTKAKIVRINEFEPVELTCLIHFASTYNLRIEWKKIRNGIPSYVYYRRKIVGDLENRAQLREPASMLIFNATRTDTAEYRCEVAYNDGSGDFDEIKINLEVRVKPVEPQCSVPKAVTVGTAAELQCLENEGFPAPVYRWFRNNEELPQDPKKSPKFISATYTMDTSAGSLKFHRVRKEDAGEYHCQAKNDAGHAHCPAKLMEVHDVDILAIILKSVGGVIAAFFVMSSIWCFASRVYTSRKARNENKKAIFSKKGQNENTVSLSAQNDGVDDDKADEGNFIHNPSFII